MSVTDQEKEDTKGKLNILVAIGPHNILPSLDALNLVREELVSEVGAKDMVMQLLQRAEIQPERYPVDSVAEYIDMFRDKLADDISIILASNDPQKTDYAMRGKDGYFHTGEEAPEHHYLDDCQTWITNYGYTRRDFSDFSETQEPSAQSQQAIGAEEMGTALTLINGLMAISEAAKPLAKVLADVLERAHGKGGTESQVEPTKDSKSVAASDVAAIAEAAKPLAKVLAAQNWEAIGSIVQGALGGAKSGPSDDVKSVAKGLGRAATALKLTGWSEKQFATGLEKTLGAVEGAIRSAIGGADKKWTEDPRVVNRNVGRNIE